MQPPFACPHRTGCDGQGVCSSVSVGIRHLQAQGVYGAVEWSIWGSGVMGLSLPKNRASASGEVCWSQKRQLPESVKSGTATTWDQLHTSCSWIRVKRQVYHNISTALKSLSLPSIPLTSVVQCIQGRSAFVLHTAIWMHRRHYVTWRWLIFMFTAYTQFSGEAWSLLGVLRLCPSHWWEPAVTTASPTRLQGSPAWQAHHCSITQLGNHSVPHAENHCF